MTQEQKQRWITALRSGMYNQTKIILKREEPMIGLSSNVLYKAGYCCLGVYLECNNLPLTGEDDLSPYGVLVSHIGDDLVDEFIVMNDRQDKSFLEIADFVEQNIITD